MKRDLWEALAFVVCLLLAWLALWLRASQVRRSRRKPKATLPGRVIRGPWRK